MATKSVTKKPVTRRKRIEKNIEKGMAHIFILVLIIQ